MTFDELKAEAEKQGYKLIKHDPQKLLPCTCGHNKRSRWYGGGWFGSRRITLECKKCGKRSPSGSNEKEAVKLWNEMITAEMESE